MQSSKLTFLDTLRKSELIAPDKLAGFLTKLGPELPEDPNELAKKFIAAGLLTKFQADLLLKGRQKGFVLRNKYKLLDLLGVGGMGRVFLCEHMLLRRLVAVKVLSNETMKDASMVERFYREARAVAALDDPNIVRVHDVESDDKMPMMVMEYVDGLSLQTIVSKGGPLTPDRAAHYVAQAARGLQHAHEAGLVHRDIKPGNLLLDRTGTIKILDMGLARFNRSAEDNVTDRYDEKIIFGTADYLAPEQAINSSAVDIRADIYSLGATFFFLLTGEVPFGDGSIAQKLLAHQTKPIPSVRRLRPNIPETLDFIIQKMMAKRREDRFQLPVDVVAALGAWTQFPIDPPSERDIPPNPVLTAYAQQTGRPIGPTSSGSVRVPPLRSAVHPAPSFSTTDPSFAVQNNPPADAMMNTPGPTSLATATLRTANSLVTQPIQSKKISPLLLAILVAGTLAILGLALYSAFNSGDAKDKSKEKPQWVLLNNDKNDPKNTPSPGNNPSVTPAGEAIPPEKAREFKGQNMTVELTVARVGKASTRYFLNSKEMWKEPDTFTIVIRQDLFESEFRGMTYEQLCETYERKRVRVTGKIDLYEGRAQIELLSKSQIQLIGE